MFLTHTATSQTGHFTIGNKKKEFSILCSEKNLGNLYI